MVDVHEKDHYVFTMDFHAKSEFIIIIMTVRPARGGKQWMGVGSTNRPGSCWLMAIIEL